MCALLFTLGLADASLVDLDLMRTSLSVEILPSFYGVIVVRLACNRSSPREVHALRIVVQKVDNLALCNDTNN